MTDDNGRDLETADLTFQANPPLFHASVRVSPAGLLAITALVSGILLSTAAIVWVARMPHRRSRLRGPE